MPRAHQYSGVLVQMWRYSQQGGNLICHFGFCSNCISWLRFPQPRRLLTELRYSSPSPKVTRRKRARSEGLRNVHRCHDPPHSPHPCARQAFHTFGRRTAGTGPLQRGKGTRERTMETVDNYSCNYSNGREHILPLTLLVNPSCERCMKTVQHAVGSLAQDISAI